MSTKYSKLTKEQKYDLLTKDFLERDGDRFVRVRTSDRLGWESTLPEGSAYSAAILNPKSDRELYNNAVALARQMITSMDTPFRVDVRVDPTRSCTDSHCVYVATKVFDDPDIDLGQKLDTFLGLTVHEGSHLLYTDFKALQENKNYLIHQLQNIFEDERIERLLGEQKPGLANFLKATKYYYFGRYEKETEEAAKNKATRLFNAILAIVRYPACLDPADALEFADELLQVRDILTPYPDSTRACFAAAHKVYDLFKKYLEQEKGREQQRSRQGQPGQQGNSGNSDDTESSDNSDNTDNNDSEGNDGQQKQSKSGKSGSKKENRSDSASSGSSSSDEEDEDSEAADGAREDSDGGSGKEDDDNAEEEEGDSRDASSGKDGEESDQEGDSENGNAEGSEGSDGSEESGSAQGGQGNQEGSPSSKKGGNGASATGDMSGNDSDGTEDADAEAEGEQAEPVPMTDEEVSDLLDEILSAIESLSGDPHDPESKKNPLSADDTAKALMADDALLAKECEGRLEIGHDGNTILIKQENNKPRYDQSLARVKRYIPAVAQALKSNGNEYRYSVTGMRSGLLDTNKLTEARQGVQNVYMRKGEVKCDRVNVVLVIDESGSMEGRRETLARDTAVLVNEAVGKLHNVGLYIYGYTSGYEGAALFPYREGNAPFQRHTIGSITSRGGTPTAPAMLEAAWRVRRSSKEKTLMFVISDGMADGGIRYVRQATDQVQKQGFEVIGISISSSLTKDHLAMMYDHYIVMNDLDNLASELGKTVKKAVLKNAKKHIG